MCRKTNVASASQLFQKERKEKKYRKEQEISIQY